MENPLTNTSKISVALNYPSAGWILMAILITEYNQNLVIHCSDVFEPFEDLMIWLHKLAGDRLPAEFEIDEEGRYKRFIAEESESQGDEIEFRIEGNKWNEQQQEFETVHFIRCKLERLQMLQEFTRSLQDWLNNKYDPLKFGYSSKEDFENGYGFDLREEIDIDELATKISPA